MLEDDYSPSALHSGNPAMLVNNDKIPDRIDAETTSFASTCPSAVAVPIVATAVCATVLIALIPAFFIHFLVSTDTLNTQFLNIIIPLFHVVVLSVTP